MSTFELKIELPTEMFTNIKGQAVAIPIGKYNAKVIETLLAKGVQRLYNDAVCSPERYPTGEEKRAQVAKMIEAHLAGDIGRQSKAAVPTIVKIARQIMRVVYKKKSKKEMYRLFTLKPGDEKTAFLDELLEKNPSLMQKARVELDRQLAEAKSLDNIDFDI